MGVPKKQRFLKLMRMEKVLPTDIDRENISDSSPTELFSLLSFAEFLRLKEEVKADHVGAQ